MESKGGEIRRVHIVYFLSRKGRIEHPHLIRVHPLNINGVRLRDVKRWLSDLRGKDMPDSFSWSYKRRYKAGYVWQDLLDDDLITPISDNEYVLKGSEISPIPSDNCFCVEKKLPVVNKDKSAKINSHRQQTTPSMKLESPETYKCNLQIEEINSESNSWKLDQEFRASAEVSSSDTSTQTEDDYVNRRNSLFKLEDDQPELFEYPIREAAKEEVCDFSSCGVLKRKPSVSKTKTSSHVFRNLLNCGAVETNDAAMMLIKRRDKPPDNSQSKNYESRKVEVCTKEFYSDNNRKDHNSKSERKTTIFANQKKASGVFTPVAEPKCSQCGKPFKPEKLHAHMKSCKGLKGRLKMVDAQRLPRNQTTTQDGFSKELESTYLLA